MNNDWLIHYPVWDLGSLGGGFLIALVATLHVYVSHFAVGGGFFLVLTEWKAAREGSPEILAYVRRHSRFFLLLTMVFGAVSGVGIWFTMSLLNPAATSKLIHIFVFAFATEWVFFLCEIVALFIYCYTFDTLPKKQHLTIGWLYAIFAFLSLFVISGIITFMLTPGDWLTSQNFWDGFFNPTFWPSVFFRFFMALMLAGLFGFITVVFSKTGSLQDVLTTYCAKWLLFSLLLLVAASFWYVLALPNPQRTMILDHSPEILPFLKTFTAGGVLIFMGGLVMAVRQTGTMRRIATVLLLFLGLGFMGSFEWIREAGRRPYIFYGLTYSNSVMVDDLDAVAQKGILSVSRWTRHKTVTDKNRIDAGREVYLFACSACHSVGGPVNDILPLTRKFSAFGMTSLLDGMGKINTYMPPFPGNGEEKKALAAYIVSSLHGKLPDRSAAASPDTVPFVKPPVAKETDPYVLLAWNSKGMHMLSDSNSRFLLSPPGNTIYTQLIRRGETPEIITEDVVISYQVEKGFDRPAAQIDFWKHAPALTGKSIEENSGVSGNTVQGVMVLNQALGAFAADAIPVVPYRSDGVFNPYPLVNITASDKVSGNVLAETKCVAPVSTEMGCRNCHGGDWRRGGVTGIAAATADDILAVHDRINRTRLAAEANRGTPRDCRDCHQDTGSASDPKKKSPLSLSAAIHGFHASYLPDKGADACAQCHPEAPTGYTAGFRGLHQEMGLECTNCHGVLEDFAAGLLVNEMTAGKPSAARLLAPIKLQAVDDINKVNPRKAWVNEPDCLFCHVGFNPPETDEVEPNQWTNNTAGLYRMRSDDAGVMCAACHGSPHSIYPATNIFGHDRDNIQPLQYQQEPYPIGANKNCRVCHTVDMADPIHHPNSLGMFRNER